MADLSTTLMGLELSSPLVVGSSGLSGTAKGVETAAESGAGAVVLKSLFEEQILAEINREVGKGGVIYGHDLDEYVAYYERQHSIDGYVKLIREAKSRVSIPIIASINAQSASEWQRFCEDLATAGADALQLNLFVPAFGVNRDARGIEETYLEIVEVVKETTQLPVAVKIGPHFTNLSTLVEGLADVGAETIVLFNRYYSPDFDIEDMSVGMAAHKSGPEEYALPLRWIALLSGGAPVPLVASTGIHTAETVIKMILAGAQAVEVVSTLYANKMAHLELMNGEIADWMDRHAYARLDDFRGYMSREKYVNPEVLERVQYMMHYGDVH